jgi:hypothetical protein
VIGQFPPVISRTVSPLDVAGISHKRLSNTTIEESVQFRQSKIQQLFTNSTPKKDSNVNNGNVSAIQRFPTVQRQQNLIAKAKDKTSAED